MIVGKHFIADLYGVDAGLIAREEDVRPLVEGVVQESGLTKVQSLYKQFNPHGVTGIVLIAESHVSIHTWPEYNLVNLEIFTCGDTSQAERAFNLFLERFAPTSYNSHVLNRGW
jgi:S-adenosylmethionine decarboxylase